VHENKPIVLTNINFNKAGWPESVVTQLASERPLVSSLVAKAVFKKSLAEEIGLRLQAAKQFRLEDKFVWLCGIYLEGAKISHSPFRTKPIDLVRRHFFETALFLEIALILDQVSRWPAIELGSLS